MAEKPSVKLIQDELKNLKFELDLIRSATGRSTNVTELENLNALLSHVERLVDLNIRRTMETRRDDRIEVSEKIESAIEKNLRKLHLDERTSRFGESVLHREWTKSLEHSRRARLKEQKAILDALYKDVSEIRKIIEALGLQFHSILTRDLPAAIAPTDPSATRKHKGRKPGAWSRALDACVNSLGVEVEYQVAAAWLDWNHPQAARDFATKYGAVITKSGGPVLQPTLRTNEKARKQFHKDLNAAKRRARSKKKKI